MSKVQEISEQAALASAHDARVPVRCRLACANTSAETGRPIAAGAGNNNGLSASPARTPPHDDRLLTRDEVFEIFGIPKRFLELSVDRPNSPRVVRIGRLVRYRPADIREWIEANCST